ncbi:F-box/LRR-repeat protein 17-like [Nicotiana tabacum]|uniref:F-box/LRR-repeat protein 17-like n=1 Tax=Nicotiana tabacum TaxID=4097 RepID=A0A1S3YQ26_TOBAC|nr:F-box/LRR-repeat protein 17 [Nicotiana tomentosiformis]XP_016454233.1 PREDICTED: F-box/LRR-repeat protein 17-like [Nicotiana tabacum]
MQIPHPHPSTPISDAFVHKRGKKRGSYNCGRCGQPKKGHVCHISNDLNNHTDVPTPTPTDAKSFVLPSPLSVIRPQQLPPPPRQPLPQLRRALSFDDVDVSDDESPVSDDDDVDCLDLESELDLGGSGKLPASALWEVLKRLPPSALLSAAKVCKGWRDVSRRIWKSAEELRLGVPVKAQIGLVGSVLQKCPGLVKLSLRMESDVDATMLACIAFSCPNLDSMEILTSDTSVNRITGDELGRFVADRRCLTNLKMEGCSNLGAFTLSSTSLSTLCLSDLFCHSKMVFNCPNLKEISLDFSRQEKDSTDLTAMVDGLGRSCPRLQNIHVASVRLTHAVVLALTAANLRGLRMLSLVLGSEITDASVAAIASSYSRLELLDLSGSSISDSGIGMICNIFPETLSKLLLALCPNITSSGIQFAAAQLPNLEIMDCGMTICDPDLDSPTTQENDNGELQRTPISKLHLIYQKLIIKHNRLKKLSLWGCSGLDALYLNCPELNDLNLNSCTNLNPERLLLQCPNLESVHASCCQDTLVETLQNQVCGDFMAGDNHFPSKRLPDGSKRIRVPHLFSPQPFDDEKRKRRISKRRCAVLVY